VIAPADRLKLAKRTKLRFDDRTQSWILLYPERGLALSQTAADILRLCDGSRTLSEVVQALLSQYAQSTEETLTRDVTSFLETMAEKSLVERV
jgi:pyrroloquinoline quinone biosynthesis protein D